jgi:hypothetical protein
VVKLVHVGAGDACTNAPTNSTDAILALDFAPRPRNADSG